MRWAVWASIGALLLALIASCGVAVWLDRRLTDPRLTDQIGDQLSHALGARVRIGSLDFSWPSWIACNETTIRLADESETGRPLAEVAELRLMVLPTSLLTRRPHITLIELGGPKITLRLTTEGKLALPNIFGTIRTSAAGPGTQGAPAPDHVGRGDPRWNLSLPRFERIRITDGELRLIEADGSQSFAARGLRLRGGVSPGASGPIGHGRVKVADIVLKNGLEIHNIAAGLAMTNSSISLQDVRATIDGATLAASLSTYPRGKIQRYEFCARVEDISPDTLKRFVTLPAYLSFDRADAELSGDAALERPEKLRASGAITAHGGSLSANALLGIAGIPATVPGWDAIDLGQVRGSLSVSNGWFLLDGLRAQPPTETVRADGDVAFGPAWQSRSKINCMLPIGKGAVRCEFSHDGGTNAMPYAADIAIANVGLPLLLKAFDVQFVQKRRTLRFHDYVDGTVSAALRADGDFTGPAGTTTGSLAVANASLAGLKLLADMGSRPDIPELTSVRFGALTGELTSRDGTFVIRNLKPQGRAAPSRFEASFSTGRDSRLTGNFALGFPLWLGRASATLALKPSRSTDQSFTLSIDLADIDTGTAFRAFRGDPKSLGGRGSLRFAGTGQISRPDNLKGNGTLAVRPAKIQGAKFLALLGALITMPGLDQLNLDSLESDFTVSERAIRFAAIRTTPKTRTHFEGQGAMTFDGDIDMRARLMLNAGLPGMISKTLGTLTLKPSDGIVAVPFRVTGKVGDPRVKLDGAGVPGAVTSGVIDHVPLVNRIPSLFKRRKPEEPKGDARTP